MTPSRFVALALPLFLAACGIPDSTRIADLESTDAEKVCKEFAKYDRTVTCDVGGTEVEFEYGMGAEDECVANFEPAPDTCTMTMGDIRDCLDAIDAFSDQELCEATETPAECDAMMSSEGC